jgi:hypothetical protein
MTEEKKPKAVKKPVPMKSLAEILAERRSKVRIVEPISEDRKDVPPVLKREPATPALLEQSDEPETEDFTGEIQLIEDRSIEAEDETETEREPVEPPPTTDTVSMPRFLFYVLSGLAGAGCIVIAVNAATLLMRTARSEPEAEETVLAQMEEPPEQVAEPEPGPEPLLEPEPPPEPEPVPLLAPEPEPEPEPAPAVEKPPPPPPEKPAAEPEKEPEEKKATPAPEKKPAEKKPVPKKKKPKPKPKKKPATKKKPDAKPKKDKSWELLM